MALNMTNPKFGIQLTHFINCISASCTDRHNNAVYRFSYRVSKSRIYAGNLSIPWFMLIHRFLDGDEIWISIALSSIFLVSDLFQPVSSNDLMQAFQEKDKPAWDKTFAVTSNGCATFLGTGMRDLNRRIESMSCLMEQKDNLNGTSEPRQTVLAALLIRLEVSNHGLPPSSSFWRTALSRACLIACWRRARSRGSSVRYSATRIDLASSSSSSTCSVSAAEQRMRPMGASSPATRSYLCASASFVQPEQIKQVGVAKE